MCYAIDVTCDNIPNNITLNYCSLCDSTFPFKGIVVFSCGHIYHVWCGIVWFKFRTYDAKKICVKVMNIQVGTRALDLQNLPTTWKTSMWIWTMSLHGV
jgi:hypothetical protein